MGPGLITGASDDDPSGIATYSQVGAQFGYGLGWTLVVSYPLMAAIQEISARIGRVTGRGIAGNLREYYPAWLLHGIVGLLLVANIINIGADLGAMGAALKLLIGGPALLYVVGFRGDLHRARSLRALFALRVGAEIADAVAARLCGDGVRRRHAWGEVAWSIVLPPLSLDKDYVLAVVAVLGTTISPYLFFWQAEEEVEEEQEKPEKAPLKRGAGAGAGRVPAHPHRHLRRHGAVQPRRAVHRHHHGGDAACPRGNRHPDIGAGGGGVATDRRARSPLRLFACGIIGTGLLALPVLAGSAAYALGEAMRWPVGLAKKPLAAPRASTGTIAVATVIGGGMNFTPIDPIKALFWSAVINGVVAVPVMVMMMLMTRRKDIMGEFVLPPCCVSSDGSPPV